MFLWMNNVINITHIYVKLCIKTMLLQVHTNITVKRWFCFSIHKFFSLSLASVVLNHVWCIVNAIVIFLVLPFFVFHSPFLVSFFLISFWFTTCKLDQHGRRSRNRKKSFSFFQVCSQFGVFLYFGEYFFQFHSQEIPVHLTSVQLQFCEFNFLWWWR